MKRLLILVIAVLISGFGVSAAHAAIILTGCGGDNVCTLAELLAGGTITIDDKRFSDFAGFLSSATSGATPVNPALIIVTPITEGGEEGLVFQGGMFVGSNQTLDTRFTFTVSTTSGADLINDDVLRVTGSVLGTGLLAIAEVVRDVPANVSIGTADLLVFSTSQTSFTADTGEFPPQDIITVSKDIFLSGGTNGTAFISDFTQLFSQVPMPGALMLLGAGIAALGAMARRKKD